MWKMPKLTEVISRIVNYTMLTPHFRLWEFNDYLVIFFFSIAIFFLLVLDFLYIVYCSKKKNAHISWPVTLLHISTELLITILFMPFFDLFAFGFYCEKNAGGVYYHKAFTDTQCYAGTHIAVVVCAVICGLLLLMYAGVMALCLFGARSNASESKIISFFIY